MIFLLLLAAWQGIDAPVNLLAGGEPWSPVAARGVQVELATKPTCPLLVTYDFRGVAGWAGASRTVELALPANFALRVRLSGSGGNNRLEIKLKQGESVYWFVRPGFVASAQEEELVIPRRRFTFAWGLRPDTPLSALSGFEVVLAAESGGQGELCVHVLSLEPLSPEMTEASFRVVASAWQPRHPPELASDGREDSWWLAPPGKSASLTVQLPTGTSLSGLVVRWGPHPPKFVRIFKARGASDWQMVWQGEPQPGLVTVFPLPAQLVTAWRLELEPWPSRPVSVAELKLHEEGPSPDLAWAWQALAQASPRGTFPRGFLGEQIYWTVTGLADGEYKVLVSEDGAVEVDPAGVTLEPMVEVGGKLYTWADVRVSRQLERGFLPLPEVRWQAARFSLTWRPRVARSQGKELVLLEAELVNTTTQPLAGTLFLLLRPFRVTPPWASLNLPAAPAPVTALESKSGSLRVAQRLWVVSEAEGPWRVSDFAGGEVGLWLRRNALPTRRVVVDPLGNASAVLPIPWRLGSREARRFRLAVIPGDQPLADVLSDSWRPLWAQPIEHWQRVLRAPAFSFPLEAGDLAQVLQANAAFILLHRRGPALQPGSRNYARSWIRDAAGMGLALLRLGQFQPVKDFLTFYAGFQFADGHIPCCVDHRGADPVPEHDAHGQFLTLLSTYTQYSGDRATALVLWPNVEKAANAILQLRSLHLGQQYLLPENRFFFGLLPPSISHEGYSAHPVHSYWDDFWALKGLKEAAELAEDLGFFQQVTFWEEQAQKFAHDLAISLRLVGEQHRLDYIPASADLADFDPASTAVAVNLDLLKAELAGLPWGATFDKYLAGLASRQQGKTWTDYTPYEARIAGALIRLGLRDQAWSLLASLLAHRRPEGWQAWPEVITRDDRAARFVGDMPHAWVGAEFINAALDAFVLPQSDRLVVAAGVPLRWLAPGSRLHVGPLATPWGWISLEAVGQEGGVVFRVDGSTPPAGVFLSWPWGGAVQVNGRPAHWQDGGVLVESLPAWVEISRSEETHGSVPRLRPWRR